MDEPRNYPSADEEESHVKLTELITNLQLPPEFEERCKSAGRASYAIDQMRRKRLRDEDEDKLGELPLDRYIQQLAKMAEVSLDDVQRSFGLPTWDEITVSTVSLLGRVARLIGLPASDTIKFARWTYLGRVDPEKSDSLFARPRGKLTSVPLEEALHQKEADYNAQQRRELSQIIAAIDSEYTEEA
jgi:hypothetical protein